MPWIRVTERYEHRWPSRALSVFLPSRGVDGNGLYNVKREVADAAIDAGKATTATKPAKPEGDEPEREAPDGMAGSDPAADRDDAPGDELQSDDGDRRGDELPGDARAG